MSPLHEALDSRWRALNWSCLAFAVLQSICTAFVALSGLRLLVGVASLAAIVQLQRLETTGFHNAVIRYPMLFVSCMGALINLLALLRIRKLRGKASAQWRMRPVSAGNFRSESYQLTLSIVTLAFVVLESAFHFYFRLG